MMKLTDSEQMVGDSFIRFWLPSAKTHSPAQLKVALKKSMARGLNLQRDIMDGKTQALDKNNDKMLCTVNSAGDRVVFG